MSESFYRSLRDGKSATNFSNLASNAAPAKKRKYVRFTDLDTENRAPPDVSHETIKRDSGSTFRIRNSGAPARTFMANGSMSGGAMRVKTPRKKQRPTIGPARSNRVLMPPPRPRFETHPNPHMMNKRDSVEDADDSHELASCSINDGNSFDSNFVATPTTPLKCLTPVRNIDGSITKLPLNFRAVSPFNRDFAPSSAHKRRSDQIISMAPQLNNALDVISQQNRSIVDMLSAMEHMADVENHEDATNLNSSSICSVCAGSAGKTGDTIDVEVLRLRIIELQEKISNLEEEKMAISLEMAPLKGQLKAREATWNSEKASLSTKMATLQSSFASAESRVQSLDMERSELMHERSELNNELRKLRRDVKDLELRTADDVFNKTVAATREMSRLEEELSASREMADRYKREALELTATLGPLKSEVVGLRQSLNEAESVASQVALAEGYARDTETKLEVLMREFIATNAALSAIRIEAAEAKCELKISNSRCSTLEIQLQDALAVGVGARNSAIIPSDGGGVLFEGDMNNCSSSEALIQLVEAGRARIAALESQLATADSQRRAMHNQLQELRGSIRVFVRTRPFLPEDNEEAPPPNVPSAVRCSSDEVSVAVVPSGGSGTPQNYVFDRVFAPSAGQEEVFGEVSSFVQSALDGYKVCLFSYGQTGSGKTHTMQGSGRGDMRGITPRAVEQILRRIQYLRDGRWEYTLEASYLEIYNEQLRDLLDPANEGGGGKMQRNTWGGSNNSSQNSSKLAIKKGLDGTMDVAGLTRHVIDAENNALGIQQLESLMAMAQKSRSMARTDMNSQSSRSHTIFTLRLRGTNQETMTTLRGVLHLVDLAGSERLDRSGAARDERLLRETQAINKSLSCLADVFSALGSKASHTPFRNSKLTYLLQDCLGGEGKALMFVNLSPTFASVQETICSLRFANQVSQVELGKAARQITFSRK